MRTRRLVDKQFECKRTPVDGLLPRALVRRPVDPRYPIRVGRVEQLVHEGLRGLRDVSADRRRARTRLYMPW